MGYPDYKNYGTDASLTQPWNTEIGYLASTTGNITGIYDMSGGSWEYVMGATVGSNGLPLSSSSGFNSSNLPDRKYYDAYPANSNENMANRILGDATGEMGPFGKVSGTYPISSWHSDEKGFVYSSYPWFYRGGNVSNGAGSGVFNFRYTTGGAYDHVSFRVVLTF